jgi:pimeloyl-ACP methyl ester carboxylesterase
VGELIRDDLSLHFTEWGDPDGHAVVLLHGLLWSAPMMERVARLLPQHRVLLLDLHGHGNSSKPTDPSRYTWRELAIDVVALIDHIGREKAVVGGLSLGANVTLATALAFPRRVAGMVIEMPVLSRAHDLARTVFGSLARLYENAGPVLEWVGGLVRKVPTPGSLPELAALRDVLSADPSVASAVLGGLLADEPPRDDEKSLRELTMPALVIGHRGDRLHVLEDARDLANRLPHARLIVSSSILEYRVRPASLAAEIDRFVANIKW